MIFDKIAETVINSGKIFTIRFRKVDGSLRTINAKGWAKKGLAGGQLKFDKKEKGIINFFSIPDNGFRSCKLDNVISIKCGGTYTK